MAISTIDSNGLTNPLTSGVTTNTITSATSTALTLKSAGTTAVTIDTSQNVGIGTSSPYTKLQVTGTIKVATGNAQGILSLGDGNGATVNCGVYRGSAGAPTTDGNYLNLGGYDGVVFTTGAAAIASQTERMRIDSSGNLLVGTTGASPLDSGRLRVYNSDSQDAVKVYQANTGTTCLWNRLDSTSSYFAVWRYGASTTVGTITTNGTGVTYGTSSDYRLKENIQPMTGALAKVAQLKPVTYKWKSNNSEGQGFIAHELQEVVPDAVQGEKDAVDADGNPVYQGIDTSFLVATLTAAIQELKAINDTQAETINALTARIEALENK